MGKGEERPGYLGSTFVDVSSIQGQTLRPAACRMGPARVGLREGLRHLTLAVLLVGLSGLRFVMPLFPFAPERGSGFWDDYKPEIRPTRPQALPARPLPRLQMSLC